jgi:hypothetical protein
LRWVNELLITILETLGLILTAFGLGVFAAWFAGAAGFLTVAGLGLLGAAYLSARQQRRLRQRKPPPAPPPAVRVMNNGVEDPNQNLATAGWGERIKKVFS